MKINKIMRARELAIEFAARAKLLEQRYHTYQRTKSKGIIYLTTKD